MAIFRTIMFLLLSLGLFPLQAAETATAYIAPGASVELRSGLSRKDKTLATLEPGSPLKILRQNARLGYSRVQLPGGEIGWLPSRALTREAPAVAPSSAAALPEAAETTQTPQQLQAEIGRLQTELIAVRQASADILRIQAERDQLQQSVISLRRELETAQRDKHALNEDQKQAWFLVGAAVLLAGILIGLLLPRLSFRRRSHWSSF
ncbi:hypothetical protein JCM19379_10230 [Methyloparacoccus murrellii]